MTRELLLQTALTAVRDACIVTRHTQTSSDETRKILKSDRSPVTVADFAAQAIVNHRLRSALGETLIVAEENAEALRQPEQEYLRTAVLETVQTVWKEAHLEQILQAIDCGDHDASAPAYWTLDPIDGTKGFLRDGQYAVSLAYIEAGEVILGVLGCPNLSPDLSRSFSHPDPHGLIFFSVKGKGTRFMPTDASQDESIAVKPQIHHRTETIRVCESVESEHSKHDTTARIIAALGGHRETARLDSQCKYAVVARGQADAYLRLPTATHYVEKIWDHAAGMLVATEAGMIVTDICAAPLDFSCGSQLSANKGIVCASPGFHERIICAIREIGIDDDCAGPA